MPPVPKVAINLNERPHIVQTGLCVHGSRAAESFCLHSLWSLHAYRYRGKLRFNGETFAFQSGWVSLIPPEMLVEWYFPGHAPHYYAHFTVRPLTHSLSNILFLQNFAEGFSRFWEAFEEMDQLYAQDPKRASVRLWDLLYQLQVERHSVPKAGLHPHLQIALSLIRNERSDNFRVGAIARAMGVSHNHLTALFQEHFGCGIQRYIQRERLSYACHLLTHSSLTIKSIAIEAGIPDLHYFNKLIRKETGLSPRAYRFEQTESRRRKLLQA